MSLSPRDPVVGFHGSPGLPEDFSALAETLGKFIQMPGETDFLSANAVGYSWGCVRLLDECVKQGMPKSVTFIAPYFFPKKRAGFVKRGFLSIPFLRDAVLKKKAPAIVGQFLQTSCAPDPVPAFVLSFTERYESTELLARAVLEKEALRVDEPMKRKFLARAEAAGTEITVVVGDSDSTCTPAQWEWLSNLSRYKKVEIPSAGHALIWTHRNELADAIT